jgi:polar amino acid transport system substrate-binding protein
MNCTLRNRVFAILATTLLAATAFAQTPTLDEINERGYIRVATANEIPYGYVDASGDARGIAPEVATAVLESMGITEEQWIVTQFGSLIPGLLADRYDMVAAEQAILPARCDQVLFSRPSSSYGEGMLVQTGNPKGIHGYQDFLDDPSLKLGIVSGADQLDFSQALGLDDRQLVMIPGNTDALSAVEAGRIDAYAATGLTVANLAAESDRTEAAEPFNDPVIDGEIVRSWGAFTFSKDHEDLRDAFDAALAEFQQTDEYREILKSHGLTDHDIDEALAATTADLCAAD